MHGSDADGGRGRRLWLSSRALVFEQRVELDLWLSATCAVVSTASDGLILLNRASDIRSDLFLTKMGTAGANPAVRDRWPTGPIMQRRVPVPHRFESD